MNAAQISKLKIAVREAHQKSAGPAGLAAELIATARTPVDRLERAEHGLRALEGQRSYAPAVALTRAAAEVTGTTASRARMLAAGIGAMTLSCSPGLMAGALYAACPRGQELPLARLLLEKTETPHEELASSVLQSGRLSTEAKQEMFARFLDQSEPRDDFRGLASAAEGMVSGRLGFAAQAEAARLGLQACADAAPSAHERSLCQLGSRLVDGLSPKLGARMAREILDDLAHGGGHEALLAEALVAKASGAERAFTEREASRWLSNA